ncbi:uncharacterized protein GGS25DRAFT_494409 [Hypoxylon fragiforme]|uniref:uncharacterized protein n=1 Tax=Hypoxylon fragiforme TaxID=63214 RepID=UPI0020C61187|nr:uncharacterized protein GGS25DRAFT_494409 [Hypoxylon fragiforme]KAI2607119.1 hypothetical protein GGS25DRAFT_494409 [Hypoxylon fragiforme]
MDHNNKKPDFYTILNVSRDADVSGIRAAYLKLSFKYHPDKLGVSSEASHGNFVQLREAYETLIDPVRRRAYDRELPPRPRPRQEPEMPKQRPHWNPHWKRPQRKESPPSAFSSWNIYSIRTVLDRQEPIARLWDACLRFRSIPPWIFPRNHSFLKLERNFCAERNNWIRLRDELNMAMRGSTMSEPADRHSNIIAKYSQLSSRIGTLDYIVRNVLVIVDAHCRSRGTPFLPPFFLWQDYRVHVELSNRMLPYLAWYYAESTEG